MIKQVFKNVFGFHYLLQTRQGSSRNSAVTSLTFAKNTVTAERFLRDFGFDDQLWRRVVHQAGHYVGKGKSPLLRVAKLLESGDLLAFKLSEQYGNPAYRIRVLSRLNSNVYQFVKPVDALALGSGTIEPMSSEKSVADFIGTLILSKLQKQSLCDQLNTTDSGLVKSIAEGELLVFNHGPQRSLTSSSNSSSASIVPARNLKPVPLAPETKLHHIKKPETAALSDADKAKKLDESIAKKRVTPSSLEDAQAILKQRRKEIIENKYSPKYTDEELLHLAAKGEVNDRYIVRIEWEKAPQQGLGFTRESGRAPIWTTTFDQIEKADSDPDLITNILGFPEQFKPTDKYKMYIIDQGEDFATNSALSIVPSYEKLGSFSKTEMASDIGFNVDLVDKVMTPEYTDKYAKHMEEFVKQVNLPHEVFQAKEVENFIMQLGQDEADLFKVRHAINSELGANPLYAGNGLTKPLDSQAALSQYGALEVFTFQRKPASTGKLADDGVLAIVPLSPLPT